MHKEGKFFYLTQPGVVGRGTVGDLTHWIEDYANIVAPGNGVEYWSDNQYTNHHGLKPGDVLPEFGRGPDKIHHAACYVREGHCEGRVIEVGFYRNDSQLLSLTWAKSFGSEEECWLIARAVSVALDSICNRNAVPEIVAMSRLLPRQYPSSRVTNLRGQVRVIASPVSVTVIDPAGEVIESLSYISYPDVATYYAERRLEDWSLVLSSAGAKFEVYREGHFVLPDLPGYLFTDRGVEGCTGIYVLKPEGNPNDDRDYLGFFQDVPKAIAGAQSHYAQAIKTAA